MKLIKKYPLATFFIGAFIISWLIWGIGIASTRGWINFKVSPDALLGIGATGPFIAALIIIGTTSGSVGLREYVKRIVKWKVGIKWILIAVFGPFVFLTVAAAIVRLSSGAWPGLNHEMVFPEFNWIFLWLLFVLFAIEEAGWRGFLLSKLQKNRSALSAALLVAIPWTLWHLPAFWFHPGMMRMWDIGIIAVVSFVIGIFVQSILYTWTYNSSGGSILMAMLLHGGFNTATMGGGEQVIMYLGGFFFMAAILVVIFARPANLSYSGKYTI